MNFKAVAMAILMGSCAFAKSDAMGTSDKVVVCLESSGVVEYKVDKAEILASSMFRQARVVIEWRASARACRAEGPRAIVVHLLGNAPPDAGP